MLRPARRFAGKRHQHEADETGSFRMVEASSLLNQSLSPQSYVLISTGSGLVVREMALQASPSDTMLRVVAE